MAKPECFYKRSSVIVRLRRRAANNYHTHVELTYQAFLTATKLIKHAGERIS
jgi:hypothetical protein